MLFEEFVRRSKGLGTKEALQAIVDIRGELKTFTEAELIEEAEKFNSPSVSAIDITIARYYAQGK